MDNDVDQIPEAVEVMRITDRDLPLSFTEDRHTETIQGIDCITQTWRMKERMKTVSVALVLCLNVGVDPPDIVKTQPCARLECWIDPTLQSPQKALENIGLALQKQYERWQPRARYKQSLDPTAEDVKKLCTSLRRNAKEERVLFHYNGHGVPKPTANGEIWVFNKNYTQYIPLSIYDLQTWMGAPSIYVYDCSNAGIIVESFKQFASQHENEQEMRSNNTNTNITSPSYHNCIQLAACSSTQVLPMNPDLPADLFTACLTTPIKVALSWFVLQSTSKLVPKVTMDLVDKIPGFITDRRTMLGELNWIFTAITDTIAWNTLPRDLFQKLFRQDLLVASLFRNFLLAERILRSCDCTPISSPALPPTYQHPMWQAWDLALDLSLGQLPRILDNNEPFQHLPFFEEQLTAFQVWLELGSEKRSPPEQLPIVLQVLLSQVHRMRALELLGKFLDLGPWAVNLALSVGIFPYVLKLLQSSAKELRPLLVFIWAKILAVDNTCQADLVRDNGHKYFLSVLQDTTISSEHRTQAAFVLACIVNDFRDGQEAAVQGSLISICLEQLGDPSPKLRQWVAICLGRLWDHYEKARWTGVRDTAHEKLYTLLEDDCPEVRAAAVYALGTYINSVTERSDHANTIDHGVVMNLVRNVNGTDMSPLVRKELVTALQWLVLAFEPIFLNVAAREPNEFLLGDSYNGGGGSLGGVGTPPPGLRKMSSRTSLRTPDWSSELKRVASSSSISTLPLTASHHSTHHHHPTQHLLHSGSYGTLLLPGNSYAHVYLRVWSCLTQLDQDPYSDVQKTANTVTTYIRSQVMNNSSSGSMMVVVSGSGGASGGTVGCYSLPPSPNRSTLSSGPMLSGQSPPVVGDVLRKFGDSGKSLTFPKTRKPPPNTITEEDDLLLLHAHKPPLVSTHFLPWSGKSFAQPAARHSRSPSPITAAVLTNGVTPTSSMPPSPPHTDRESRVHYEREWRYLRNAAIRAESLEQQKRAKNSKLDSQIFNMRCQVPPSIVQFHPYDQQIVVAGRDGFSVWDWGTGAKLVTCNCSGSGSSTTSKTSSSSGSGVRQVTALEWVNGFDVSMVMAGLDDGSVKLYRTATGDGNKEMGLVSAWRAHGEMMTSPATTTNTLLLTWEQYTQTIITAGTTRVIRTWDASRERRVLDIPTGTDSSVTCLDSSYASVAHERLVTSEQKPVLYDPSCDNGLVMREQLGSTTGVNSRRGGGGGEGDSVDGGGVGSSATEPVTSGLVVAGFEDGGVRVYDRRCAPSEAKVAALLTEHGARVLAVQLKENRVISGSTNGDVKIYDLRDSTVLPTQALSLPNMTALAIHRNAEIYACGSANQTISIYNMDGNNLNVIRFYEGFMNYRIGPVSCLSFHPHKVALGAGTTDCSVSVYTLDQRR